MKMIIHYQMKNEKATNIERYSVEHPMKLKNIQEKRNKTMIEKYGVEHPIQNEDIRNKIKNTVLKRYGVEYSIQNQEIRNKIKETMLERYGSEYPFENYNFKDYILPSGKIIQIQGYENLAIDLLLILGYIEEEIITNRKDVPKIKYQFEDKERKYFPDIYLPNENKIIEVKSEWTYQLWEEKNKTKEKACINQGYLFEFWIFDNKGVLI